MIRRTLIAVAALAVAYVGLIQLAKYNIFHLYYNGEVKPIEVLGLAVAVLIAAVLQEYFTTQQSDSRVEKDLLIDIIRDVLSLLRLCRDTVTGCHELKRITPEKKASIVLVVRRVSNGIDSIETALRQSKCAALAKECPSVQQAYFRYKQACTGGSFPAKPYSAEMVRDQERAFRELSELLQSLVFKTNRHPR